MPLIRRRTLSCSGDVRVSALVWSCFVVLNLTRWPFGKIRAVGETERKNMDDTNINDDVSLLVIEGRQIHPEGAKNAKQEK